MQLPALPGLLDVARPLGSEEGGARVRAGGDLDLVKCGRKWGNWGG